MEVTNEIILKFDKLTHYIINRECRGLVDIYGHEDLHSVATMRVIEKLQRMDTITEETPRILSGVIRLSVLEYHRANKKHTHKTSLDNVTLSYNEKVNTLKTIYTRDIERKLKPLEREVFNMYLDGYKQREIALETGWSQQKVSNIINNVKKICKNYCQ